MATNGQPGAFTGDDEYVQFVSASDISQNAQGAQPAPTPLVVSSSSTTSTATTVTNQATRNAHGARPRTVHMSRGIDIRGTPPSPPARPSDPEEIARSRELLRRFSDRTLRHQMSDPGPTVLNTKPHKRLSDMSHQTTRKVVVAIYDYTPMNDDDLAFTTGDVMEVLRDGYLWWFARHPDNGHVGYIPKNHVRPYSAPITPVSKDYRTSSGLAIAIANYESAPDDELNFQDGDIFIVLNDIGTWWYVRQMRTKHEGFVQRGLIKPMSDIQNEPLRHTFSI